MKYKLIIYCFFYGNLNLVIVDIYIFKGGVFILWFVNKLFDFCNEFFKFLVLEIINRGVLIF